MIRNEEKNGWNKTLMITFHEFEDSFFCQTSWNIWSTKIGKMNSLLQWNCLKIKMNLMYLNLGVLTWSRMKTNHIPTLKYSCSYHKRTLMELLSVIFTLGVHFVDQTANLLKQHKLFFCFFVLRRILNSFSRKKKKKLKMVRTLANESQTESNNQTERIFYFNWR